MDLGRQIVGPFRLALVLGLLGLDLGLGALGLRSHPTADTEAEPAFSRGPSPTRAGTESEAPPQTPPPRLAVLVVFDQMRADYLTRWDPLFGGGGFKRLKAEGAWFSDCHYPYADTVTAAGHASLATGCSPDKHGIIANDWYDRSAGAPVYCVSSARYPLVPPRSGGSGKDSSGKSGGASPERLRQPTLADALKGATGGRGRVVALSLKDRSAVLPGGRRPDACYWFDARGLFVTSTYYRDRPHPWVEESNRSHAADRWLGQQWTRLRGDLDYERYSGPDDAPGEGSLGFGRTFPHPLGKGRLGFKGPYYGSLYNSPFGNDLLLGLTRRAVEAEGLGSRATPDLLCVSFSSNDAIGHCWGPDSQEVLDVTLRSDLIVKDLLHFLDARVGKGRYVLALTADHGVCPLPEAARRRGEKAARIDPGPLWKKAEEHLSQTFPGGKPGERWLEKVVDSWVYLDRALLARRGVKQAEAEEALARWLAKQPGIEAAYTRTRLLAGVSPGDRVGQAVRHSFDPDRSGDVTLIVKPYHLLTANLTGTTHGTPHGYDTHVPLLVYGPGIRPGERREPVTPQASAVILAHALGIDPPSGAEAPLPGQMFEDK